MSDDDDVYKNEIFQKYTKKQINAFKLLEKYMVSRKDAQADEQSKPQSDYSKKLEQFSKKLPDQQWDFLKKDRIQNFWRGHFLPHQESIVICLFMLDGSLRLSSL